MTSGAQAVSRQSQSIPLLLAKHTAFSELARTYTSIDGVAEDFAVDSVIYKMAQFAFGQQIVPPSIVVGRGQVNSLTLSVATLANSSTYKITINGNDYTFLSDSNATAIEIIAGLKADYDLDPITGITFVDNTDGTATIGVSTAGTAYSFVAGSNLSTAYVAPTTPSTDAVNDLNAVADFNNEWYCLIHETRTASIQKALAIAIQSMDQKIYVTATSDSGAIASTTTDIGAELKALSLDKTAVMYSPNAATEYLECGWASRQLQDVAGSNDWCYKEIKLATPYKLSATATANLKSKNYTTYETLDNVNRTVGGNMASGRPIDSRVLEDWWVINARANLWQVKANIAKIPYTQQGMNLIESTLRATNAQGIANGGIASSPAPTITMPVFSTISTIDKSNRHLPNVRVRWTETGSIRTTDIYLTIDV